MNHKAVEEAAAAWFAKRDKGGLGPEDQREFDAWLARDVAHRVAFIRIQAAWNQAQRLKALGAGIERGTVPEVGAWHFSRLFDHQETLERAAQPKPAARHVRRWFAAAASMAVIALVLAWSWRPEFETTTKYHTSVGGLETVPMSDGSTVTLNTDSEIGVALTDRVRTVKLPHGEAFFEVAKDSRRPFVVEAGKMRVTAVGTKFSVWNDADVIRVAVTEGHVLLETRNGHGAPPVHLLPGDIARVDRDATLIQQKPLSLLEAEYLSWREGYVVFHEKPLGEALEEFNRYSTEKAVVTDPELAAIKIGGSFRVSNIEAFMHLLAQGLPVRVVKKGGVITLEHE